MLLISPRLAAGASIARRPGGRSRVRDGAPFRLPSGCCSFVRSDPSSGRERRPFEEDNMRVLSAVCIILGAIGTQPALAEPSASDLTPRTEIHAIETITLSDQGLFMLA
jgi:hypothetical protein